MTDHPEVKIVAEPTRLPTLIRPPEVRYQPGSRGSLLREARDWYLSQAITIPAGAFLRGSLVQENEQPQREIYLSEYRLGRTAVTVGMYLEYCNATGEVLPPAPSWGWFTDHPMVNVSWAEARAYAVWAGLALPTEAQWEKAAAGPHGYVYPWGNVWNRKRCVSKQGGHKQTMPVGSHPDGSSFYGLRDMAGNVAEWCEDWYQEDWYEHAASKDPVGPSLGELKVLRGGSWFNKNETTFRCAARARYVPNFQSDYRGFRLVVPE
jgi:formylglycine-generating enzyme